MTTREFNQCVDDHADAVYRFILKSIRDEDKARDIVQDAFEKMWLHHTEVEGAKAKAYLFTTAYHRLIDGTRRERKQSRLEEVHMMSQSVNNGYTDVKEVIDEALNHLPEAQRSVLMLRDYEGYSYEEIGQITGLNESQVKVYIFRARMTLKAYIGKLENVI
jgi:RNA polymerase sigma-70 factor (ECF subfamily)